MMRADEKTQDELRKLKLHENESLNDVVVRLIHAKSLGVETDAFENAKDRYEKYLKDCREKQLELYHEQLRKKNSDSAGKVAEAKKLLGIDSKKDEVTPAWLKVEKEE